MSKKITTMEDALQEIERLELEGVDLYQEGYNEGHSDGTDDSQADYDCGYQEGYAQGRRDAGGSE
jgi:flagellar biosynthesis/type III secretory pathway protein FliH